jgi:hypothetical protein
MAIRKAAQKDQSNADAPGKRHRKPDFKRRLTNVWANREASKWARRASRPAGVSGEANRAVGRSYPQLWVMTPPDRLLGNAY